MWTAVLGEHDRLVEEGYEQRLMVEKIVMHERFKEYHNDLGMFRFFSADNSIWKPHYFYTQLLDSFNHPFWVQIRDQIRIK